MATSETPKKWGHDELAADLAAHLAANSKPSCVWLDMQLGPQGSPRPDVYAIAKTFTALLATSFEVKVTRADFQRDVSAGKYASYRPYSSAIVFASTRGLIRSTEIPDGCGLIERGPDGWRYARKPARMMLETLPPLAWLKLVIDGIERVHGPQGPKRREVWGQYQRDQLARRLLGEEIAGMMARRDQLKVTLVREINDLAAEIEETGAKRREAQELNRKRYEEQLASLKAEINREAEHFGLPPNSQTWSIRTAINELRPENDREAIERALSAVEQARDTLATQGQQLRRRLGLGNGEEREQQG